MMISRQKTKLPCCVLWLADCILPVSTLLGFFLFLFLFFPCSFFFLSFLFHLSYAYWEWSGKACFYAVSRTVKIGRSKFENSTFVYFLSTKWLCCIWVISLTVEKITAISSYNWNFLYILSSTQSWFLGYLYSIWYSADNWKHTCINLINLNLKCVFWKNVMHGTKGPLLYWLYWLLLSWSKRVINTSLFNNWDKIYSNQTKKKFLLYTEVFNSLLVHILFFLLLYSYSSHYLPDSPCWKM